MAWLPLGEAVRRQLTSMVPGSFVDDFQRRAFHEMGRAQRAPMFITATVLLKVRRTKRRRW